MLIGFHFCLFLLAFSFSLLLFGGLNMYQTILDALTSWLFGAVALEPWQNSFLAISTIVIITFFTVAIFRVFFSFFKSLLRW